MLPRHTKQIRTACPHRPRNSGFPLGEESGLALEVVLASGSRPRPAASTSVVSGMRAALGGEADRRLARPRSVSGALRAIWPAERRHRVRRRSATGTTRLTRPAAERLGRRAGGGPRTAISRGDGRVDEVHQLAHAAEPVPEAEAGGRDGERARLGADPDVGLQGHQQATADAVAVDLGDDRLGDVPPAPATPRRCGGRSRRGPPAPCAGCRTRRCRHRRRTPARRHPSMHDHADGVVGLPAPRRRRRDRLLHRERQHVVAGRVVEREAGDARRRPRRSAARCRCRSSTGRATTASPRAAVDDLVERPAVGLGDRRSSAPSAG